MRIGEGEGEKSIKPQSRHAGNVQCNQTVIVTHCTGQYMHSWYTGYTWYTRNTRYTVYTVYTVYTGYTWHTRYTGYTGYTGQYMHYAECTCPSPE